MTKKDNETFKEYSQCWREITSKVEPPIFEKELVTMFIDTLKYPFYEKIFGTSLLIFFDIVIIRGRVEMTIKSRRFINSVPKAAKVEKPRLEEHVEEDLANNIMYLLWIGPRAGPFSGRAVSNATTKKAQRSSPNFHGRWGASHPHASFKGTWPTVLWKNRSPHIRRLWGS